MTIGAQGRGEDQGVPAVVLGAGRREAVAEAVELLGVDREDGDPAIHQRLNHRAVRRLDGDRDVLRMIGLADQPVHQRTDPERVVRERPLHRRTTAHQTHLMLDTRPIDAGENPGLLLHACLPCRSGRRVASPFPVLALRPMVRGRDSPLGLQRGRPAGAHVPPRRSQTQGAKGCSRPASPRRSSYPKTAT